jgi:hypothetical protein
MFTNGRSDIFYTPVRSFDVAISRSELALLLCFLLIIIIVRLVSLLAAALDPRYGNLPWISGDLRGSVWRHLDQELQLITIPKIVDNLDSSIPDSDDSIAQSASKS